MKILIIGAKGMLGQALVKEFAKDYEVVAWDRDEVDLARIKNYESRINDLKPDLIINAAAYTNVDKADEEPEVADQINGYAVGDLANIGKELNIPIVHFSTEYVFDGAKRQGYNESDLPNPISRYGASKLLGEQELRKNTDKFYLIRLSRLFGKAGAGKPSFVDIVLELAKTKNEIEVVDEEASSPTYAADLARLTRYIVENTLPFGIYHGANSGSCTWFGLAAEIFKIMGQNVKLMPVAASRFSRSAPRPAYGILLNTKLPPARPWQEALREFLTTPSSSPP